jgi:hypothetical protein
MLDRAAQRGAPLCYEPAYGDAPGVYARVPRPCDDPQEVVASWSNAGAEIVGAVGHPDTATLVNEALGLVNKALGVGLEHNRIEVKLDDESAVLIAQVVRADGSPYRLPPGTTVLPDDATMEWWIV